MENLQSKEDQIKNIFYSRNKIIFVKKIFFIFLNKMTSLRPRNKIENYFKEILDNIILREDIPSISYISNNVFNIWFSINYFTNF